MGKPKDTLWKGVLEQLFEDFLFFLNPDLANAMDSIKQFEFKNTELNQAVPSDQGIFEHRIVDTLVKINLEHKKWAILHLEVQDKYSQDFSERMYTYFNKLYDKYKVPIIAYAIFIEPNEIKRADTFDINYMGTRLAYKFNTCKIAEYDDDYLIGHPSCFALIMLIAKGCLLKKKYKNKQQYDDQLLAYKLKAAKIIIERKLPTAKETILMNFLFHYINFEFTLTNTIF